MADVPRRLQKSALTRRRPGVGRANTTYRPFKFVRRPFFAAESSSTTAGSPAALAWDASPGSRGSLYAGLRKTRSRSPSPLRSVPGILRRSVTSPSPAKDVAVPVEKVRRAPAGHRKRVLRSERRPLPRSGVPLPVEDLYLLSAARSLSAGTRRRGLTAMDVIEGSVEDVAIRFLDQAVDDPGWTEVARFVRALQSSFAENNSTVQYDESLRAAFRECQTVKRQLRCRLLFNFERRAFQEQAAAKLSHDLSELVARRRKLSRASSTASSARRAACFQHARASTFSADANAFSSLGEVVESTRFRELAQLVVSRLASACE